MLKNNLEFFHIFESLEQPKEDGTKRIQVADGRNKNMTAGGRG